VKSEQLNTKYQIPNTGKGTALLMVLILVAAVTIIGLGFIVRGDTELLCGQNMEMAADMSYLAESGLEQGKGLIMYPQDVLVEYWPGATGQQLAAGSSDYYDVNVTKLSELNWQITSIGYRKTNGDRTAQNSLTANLRLDPAVAFWSGTSVLLSPAASITGDVYCNGVLTNSGTINGDCFADSLVGNAATGSVKSKSALDVNKPAINCSILTSNFSTQTISNNNLDNKTSSDSTEVYYKNGNLEIKSNVIINGCLAVDGNLTVSGTGNVITAKKNIPAVYVSGNLVLEEDASITITGLVFVNGQVKLPACSTSPDIINMTGSLFTNGGIVYRKIVPNLVNVQDGTINGDCALVPGKVGGAINFDGNGDFIDVESFPNVSSQITVAAWIKVTAFDKPYQAIVTRGNTRWRLERYVSTNYVEFVVYTVGGEYIYAGGSGANVNDGQWHHIAGVYDGSTIGSLLYVDGNSVGNVGEPSGNISTSSWPIYIGENAEKTGRYFNGLIDDVRIYNTALSQPGIRAIITGGSPAPANLIGYWPMDCGTTTVVVAPTKAAIYDWPNNLKNRWSSVGGAFYKSITRNP
jgi:cytoskeletal protein CcmA (bactofilin family)